MPDGIGLVTPSKWAVVFNYFSDQTSMKSAGFHG